MGACGVYEQHVCRRRPEQLMWRVSVRERMITNVFLSHSWTACYSGEEGGRVKTSTALPPNSLTPFNQYCINLLKLSAWPKTDDARVRRRRRGETLPPSRQQLVTNSEFSTAHRAHNWLVASSPWHNSITALRKVLTSDVSAGSSVSPNSAWCVCVCELCVNRGAPADASFSDLFFVFFSFFGQMCNLTDGSSSGSYVNVSSPTRHETLTRFCRCELMKGARAEAAWS